MQHTVRMADQGSGRTLASVACMGGAIPQPTHHRAASIRGSPPTLRRAGRLRGATRRCSGSQSGPNRPVGSTVEIWRRGQVWGPPATPGGPSNPPGALAHGISRAQVGVDGGQGIRAEGCRSTSSGPRKSGDGRSVEKAAPVSTTMRRADAINALAVGSPRHRLLDGCSPSAQCTEPLPPSSFGGNGGVATVLEEC